MNVLELVQKYPRIFPLLPSGKTNPEHIRVPLGWIRVLDNLFATIQYHVDNHVQVTETDSKRCEQVVCTQLKEKFGSLRFYYTGGDAYVSGMVTLATYICDRICAICSTDQDLGITTDYLSICCKDCFENGRAPGLHWKTAEEMNNLNYVGQTNGTEQG